jgi:hypothetical protein
MSTEVRLMNVCRTLQASPATSVLDIFTTIDTSPPNSWADVGGTLDGVASTGIIVASGGLATTTAYDTLHTAYFSLGVAAPGPDTLISTNSPREVTLKGVVVPDTSDALGVGSVSILMDMADTTPVYTTGLRMKVERLRDASLMLYWKVTLYIDDAAVATGTLSPSASTTLTAMRMSIDGNQTIRCWLDSFGFAPVITYDGSSYNPVGGRVGIVLKSNPFAKASVDSFTFSYTLAAVVGVTNADLPPRTLVSSANGVIYVELKNGNLATLTSPVRTLASDRLLSSVNRLEKLYIADYGLLKHGLGTGSNGTPTSATFTDSGVADWTALGKTAAEIIADYRLEVLSGTTAPIGIYNITAAAATLTLSPMPPQNGSVLYYRVVRAPKIFDSALMTLTLVPIGNVPDAAGLAVDPGQYPLGCTIVSAWDDRLLWGGDPLFPHVVYMSKAGDPDNYLYANETEGEAFAYDPARVSGAAQIGDSVTAIIPHSHDYCIFAGYRSFSIQRGDPTIGGALDLISRDIGIVGFAAWCYTPEQVILGLSPDGLYLFQPSPDVAPVRVSRERLPTEMLNINPDLYDVQLAFDLEKNGVVIAVTPKIAGATTHFWFDWGKKAFWPESYQSDHEPTAMCVHTIDDVRTVIFGCRDGYLRRFVDTSPIDDGNPIPSSALLGPFQAGSPQFHGLIHKVCVELATQSGQVTIDILAGDSPQKARAALPAHSFTVSGGGDSFSPPPELCRIRCGACFIRITNSSSFAWAKESGFLEREIVGMRRAD